MHKEMKDELKQLDDDVAGLFIELLDVEAVDWEKQWQEGCTVQEAVISATIKNKASVLRDLQALRAQTEAWLTLKYEVEEFFDGHDEVCLQWMKSMMEMITSAPGFSKVKLPNWFVPAYQGEYEAEPFGTGPCGSVHYETQGDHDKAVVKLFRVDDGVIDESAQRKIEKELDFIFEMDHVNVARMLCSSHVSSPPFVIHRFASNGNLRSFLSRSEENKLKMWRLLYQAALGLEHMHSKDVTHGSLKLSNILADAERDAQLADFGLHTLRMCVNLLTKAPRDLIASSVRYGSPRNS